MFSKLGAGYSTSRSVGEIVTAGYACVPAFDFSDDQYECSDCDGPSYGGLEFALAARASVSGDTLLVGAQERVRAAVDAAVGALARGDVA